MSAAWVAKDRSFHAILFSKTRSDFLSNVNETNTTKSYLVLTRIFPDGYLRPPHRVLKAYQQPPIDYCFIAICICINPKMDMRDPHTN